MAAAAGWAVAAPWLSAQRFISVLAELISYWPCVLVDVGGAYITLASRSESAESGSLFWRRVYVAGALGTVLESNGVAAAILFGYKGRAWGLCVGPELFAKRYGRGGGLVRVGANAFFFAERRD